MIKRQASSAAVADMMRALSSHAIHTAVGFNPTTFKFCAFHARRDGTAVPVQYRGIHRLIRSVFYPDFDYTKTKVVRSQLKSAAPPASREAYFAWLDSLPRALGREGGLLFAKTVEDCHFLNNPEVDDKTAERDVLYRQFKEFVTTRGYEVLKCEFILNDPLLGFSTRVDLIVALKDTLFLVELKTGFADGKFVAGTGKMNRVAEVLFRDNSPKNQAILQVLLPTLTVSHYTGVCATPVVWHVQPDGVTEHFFQWPLGGVSAREKLYTTVLNDIADAAQDDEDLVPPVIRNSDAKRAKKA
jgi:hypothetical protein